MLSVIRIALKWLRGSLCGYVITTTGVTEVHHILHQSEGCVVMIYRLFLEKVLHSHNDDNKWDFICLEQRVSVWMVCPDAQRISKLLSQLIFQLCIFTGRPQPFQHMHGCSLQIPFRLTLFKPWLETLVW